MNALLLALYDSCTDNDVLNQPFPWSRSMILILTPIESRNDSNFVLSNGFVNVSALLLSPLIPFTSIIF